MVRKPDTSRQRRADLRVHPELLGDQSRQFADREEQLADVLHDGVRVLTELERTGLGWDESGRPFSVPYWSHQTKLLAALHNAVTVMDGIGSGMEQMARRMTNADREVATKFRKLGKTLADPSVQTQQYLPMGAR